MDFAIPSHIAAMREQISQFLREKVYPNEQAWFDYDEKAYPACSEDHPEIKQLQAEVKELGLWAGHLPREAGGMGLSIMEYGLLNEIIGRSYFAPRIFGSNAPDSGNAEILWHYGTAAQHEHFFLALATRRCTLIFQHDRARCQRSRPNLAPDNCRIS